jgi:hypothetical protein
VVTCDTISTHTAQDEEDRQLPPEDRDSRLRKWLGERGLRQPKGSQAAWPDFFYVAQEGSVTWYLYGKPKTEVIVRFGLKKPKKYYDPFTDDSTKQSEFRGVIPELQGESKDRVPGVIVAAPVVNPGRGDYEIVIKEPNMDAVTLDPGGGGPKKGG